MKKILFFLIVLTIAKVQAQGLKGEGKVAGKIKLLSTQLRSRGVDTIFVYQRNSYGYNLFNIPKGSTKKQIDSLACEAREAAYVFWLSKGLMHAQKLHPCILFDSVQLENSKISHFIGRQSILRAPEIKPFQYRDKQGKTLTTYDEHIVQMTLTLRLGTEEREILVNSDALSKRIFEIEAVNINYEENNNNLWAQLATIANEEVKALNFKRVLIDNGN
ncbi:hypothetical protein [Rubrolithibacter danxiaensis]|uniref:hypothetical protein n=1 Tax=Rubrolithibacter danxiaensis TaxID=3390805 RepID=UPI003BF82410